MSAPNFRKVRFRSGLAWLPAAAELLFSALRPLSGLAALWLLISMLVLIPLIGQALVILITPLLTAGAILAFAELAGGGRPTPATLLAAWRRPELRNRLLGLGAFALFGSIAVLAVLAAWLGTQASPEQILAAQHSPEAMAELMTQLSAGPLLIVAAVLMTVIVAAMYFAVPLLVFAGGGPLAALGLSLRAVLSNWAAFIAFVATLILTGLALGVVLAVLSLALGLALGGIGQGIAQVLFLLVAMLFQVLMAGTQWVAMVDIFGNPRATDDSDQDRDQLLA